MFTVCPKCALTLVVTAADLRVAQGYVRCGRCSSVFNALARLSDDRQGAIPGGEPAEQSTPEPAEPAQEAEADLSPLEEALIRPDRGQPTEPTGATEESIPEGALEFNPDTTDVGAVFVEPPPNPQWTAATGSFKAMRAASQAPGPEVAEEPASERGESQVDVEIDAAQLADMLREPSPDTEPQRAEPRSEPQHSESQHTESQTSEPEHSESRFSPSPTRPAQPRRAAAPVSEPPARTAHAGHTRPEAEASVRPRSVAARGHAPRTHEARVVQEPEEPASAALDTTEDETARTMDTTAEPAALIKRLSPHTWGAAAAVALLVLLAQIVNHYRDELAANPRFNHPLTALYGSLGVQLAPHWDLRAYDVRQLGASADPAGTGLITVRASIKNAGRQPQPLPLLRVTLQDRFGNRIAARDVAPRFYVPHSMPDSSYLAGGQRIDAEMGFVDPGANAVGFEIDACLPASGGGVTCANDLAAR